MPQRFAASVNVSPSLTAIAYFICRSSIVPQLLLMTGESTIGLSATDARGKGRRR
jgi:hypothetical protein